jgi:hypothetical protein
VKISRPEVREALRTSGYLLEQRVHNLLSRLGFQVETNPTYPDPVTGKTRELDIVATRQHKGSYGVATVLVCECKNNSQPVVLFESRTVADPTHASELSNDCKSAGLPGGFWTGNTYVTLEDFVGYPSIRHYCQGSYATQYCSFKATQNRAHPWLALHDDQHHASLDGLLAGLDHRIDRLYAEYTDYLTDWSEVLLGYFDMRMYYPILILQGDLLSARFVRGRLVIRKVASGRLRVERFGPGGAINHYQIDFVTEAGLPRLLDAIDDEVNKTGEGLTMGDYASRVEQTFEKLRESAPSAQKQGMSLRRFLEPRLDGRDDPIHDWPPELRSQGS